jgi:hypothetical protein
MTMRISYDIDTMSYMTLQIDSNVNLLYYRFYKRCFQAFEIADLYEAYVTSAGDKELLNILKSETM